MVQLFSCCIRNSSRVEENNDIIETKLIGQTKFIKLENHYMLKNLW